MSMLRAAMVLILAGGSSVALADQVTCESQQEATARCPLSGPASVTLAEQISKTPCIEGSNWGVDGAAIWVSGGCRARFDVQPQFDQTAQYDAQYGDQRSPEWQHGFEDGQRNAFDENVHSHDYRAGFRAGRESMRDQYAQDNNDAYDRGEHYAQGARYAANEDVPAGARRACVDQASAGRYEPDQVSVGDVRRIGDGMLALELDTPDGALSCKIDRYGNIRSIDNRY